MKNSRWARSCLLVLLSFSLTACDQMLTQLDQLIQTETAKPSNCSTGNHCVGDMNDDQELNWFLKEVVKRP